MEKKIGYIYVLVDPREPENIRYVGQTVDPNKRIKKHLIEAKNGKHRRANWIKNLLNFGITPELFILDEFEYDKNLLNDRERYLILYYRHYGFDLTNGTDGGEGFDPQTAKKLAEIIAKSKNKLTVDERKKLLLDLPVGALRPGSRTELGKFLCDIILRDDEFCFQIKLKHPTWFNKERIDNNKAEILSIPIGEKRPSNKTTIGKSLSSYITKNGDMYDEEFTETLKVKQPTWFKLFKNQITIERKTKLLEMPIGEKRPSRNSELGSALCRYVKLNGSCYDDGFCKSIKQRQPNWFREEKNIVNKDTLLAIPVGEKRPSEDTYIGKICYHYVNKNSPMYDSIFADKIISKHPGWFPNQV